MKKLVFKEIDFLESLKSRNEITHAVHGLIYCRQNRSFEGQKQRANVFMVSRFDGKLGFPGGIVDKEDDSIIDALNRECVEEVALNISKIRFEQNDHIITRMSNDNKLVVHFYSIEVAESAYEHIEKNISSAKDWGTETLGFLRVPLYTMADGRRGFPCFLDNQFSGDARFQLLATLSKQNLISDEEFKLFDV